MGRDLRLGARTAAAQDRDHPRRQQDEGQQARVHARDRRLPAPAWTHGDAARRQGDAPRRRRDVRRRPARRRTNWYARAAGRARRRPALTACRSPARASRSSRSRRTCCRSCRARWPSRAASPAPTARCNSASSCRARTTARCSRSAPQPPESKQIDVLNIFNDGSQQDRTGHDDVDDAHGPRPGRGPRLRADLLERQPADLRRAGDLPRRHQLRHASQFVDGKFQTDGAKSTIEVVNLHARPGQRHASTIQGTLDPDVAVKLTGTIVMTSVTGAPGVPGMRRQAHAAAAVRLEGPGLPRRPAGPDHRLRRQTWTVVGFADDDLDRHDRQHRHVPDGHAARRRRSSTRCRSTSTSRRTVARRVTVGAATGGDNGSPARAGDWITDGFVVGQRSRSPD